MGDARYKTREKFLAACRSGEIQIVDISIHISTDYTWITDTKDQITFGE